jgi:hypothetical protein
MLKILALSLTMLLTSTVNAELVNADFLTEGDGKGAYDDTHQKFWVDLTETQGLSVNEAMDLIETDYQGFRIANENDIYDLYNVIVSESEYLSDNSSMGIMASTLGVTLQQTRRGSGANDHNVYSTNEARGWYINTELNEMHGAWEQLTYVSSGDENAPSKITKAVNYDYYRNQFDHSQSHSGVYLVKDNVVSLSVPGGVTSDVSTAFGIGAISFSLLLGRLRRRKV